LFYQRRRLFPSWARRHLAGFSFNAYGVHPPGRAGTLPAFFFNAFGVEAGWEPARPG
jgi:hypothetical protein